MMKRLEISHSIARSTRHPSVLLLGDKGLTNDDGLKLLPV
jgi:hypothetical protein